jgi:hypothetical protein
MGAFFIVKRTRNISDEKVKQTFARQGLTNYLKVSLGEYDLFSFGKILTCPPNQITSPEGNSLYSTGTLVYKGLGYEESLKQLLDDHRLGQLDETELLGTFCLIFTGEESIELLIDSMSIQNVFYNQGLDIISSSFLAVCSTEPHLKLNVSASTECICTGSLMGPDTLVTSVFRVEPFKIPKISGLHIHFARKPEISDKSNLPFEQEVERQNNRLKNYFKKVKPLADAVGVDSGITGGHDSRLLMAVALPNWNKISFHSHYRKVKDEELQMAEKICDTMNLHLKQVEIIPPEDMTEVEFADVLDQTFHFFDGNIRMHTYWTESYNTPGYRTQLLGSARLGLSGIGGEQYRNMEGMYGISWNYHNFIRYVVLLNTCGHAFKTVEEEKKLVNRLKEKISAKLEINQNTSHMTMLTMKRYFNEVFIPARLGMRNNAENKLSFFLSPLTDPFNSFMAYKAIPHLGVAYRFQELMIAVLNPKLAAVQSSYGFNFLEGEPLSLKLKQLLQNVIPHSILQKRIDSHWKHNNTAKLQQLIRLHPDCVEYIQLVKQMELPIDIDTILKRIDLMPLVLALGFMIKKLNIQK